MSAKPPTRDDPARTATLFVVKLVVLTLALGFAEAYLNQINWGTFWQETVAGVAGRLATWCNPAIAYDGNIIFATDHTLVVTLECTALFAQGLFCAAALAYPCTWRARLTGCCIGIAGVAVLNVLRIAGLVLIAEWAPGFFHFAHLVLMQWFLISCVAPLWLAWAVWTTRRAAGRAAKNARTHSEDDTQKGTVEGGC